MYGLQYFFANLQELILYLWALKLSDGCLQYISLLEY